MGIDVASDASTVSYAISGTDSTRFNVDSSTGIVSFLTAPDYNLWLIRLYSYNRIVSYFR